jgi:hypothetical protein
MNDNEHQIPTAPLSPAEALKSAIELENQAVSLPDGASKNALLEQARSLRALADATDLTPP